MSGGSLPVGVTQGRDTASVGDDLGMSRVGPTSPSACALPLPRGPWLALTPWSLAWVSQGAWIPSRWAPAHDLESWGLLDRVASAQSRWGF